MRGGTPELSALLGHPPAARMPEQEVLIALFPILVAALCLLILAVTALARRGFMPPLDERIPAGAAIAVLAASLAFAAAVGWARRGVSLGVARPLRTALLTEGSPLASAVRRLRRGLGRETGAQS